MRAGQSGAKHLADRESNAHFIQPARRSYRLTSTAQRAFFFEQLVPTSQQFVKGRNDSVALLLQGSDPLSKVFPGDGNDLERV